MDAAEQPAPPASERPRHAWRLMSAPEWHAMQAAGEFAGSEIDLRDGFVHMSPASAVRDTARLYFAGQTDLWLLQIDLLPLGDDIRLDWVASRAVHFPHLLNRRLPLTAVVGSWPVPWDGAAFSAWPSELQ